jgi:hypothetical protein
MAVRGEETVCKLPEFMLGRDGSFCCDGDKLYHSGP